MLPRAAIPQFLLAVFVLLAGTPAPRGVAEETGPPSSAKEKPVRGFFLTSPAFAPGARIPIRYTADGGNVSPPLRWTDPPEGTKALLLICDDPDAPRGTWTHWILADLPPGLRELPEAVPPLPRPPVGGVHGRNDFRKIGYGGPSPPPGRPHRYFFRLYALDRPLAVAPNSPRAQVAAALGTRRVLAEATLMGLYGR